MIRNHHVSLVSRESDRELSAIQARVERTILVGDRVELEEIVGRLLAEGDTTPKTLDLIGHSNEHGVLVLGTWTIDAGRRVVRSFFRGLADNDVFARLGVTAIRVLGCETVRARETLQALSDICGIPVFGSTQMLGAVHYEPAGFREDCEHALVAYGRAPTVPAWQPSRRTFDVDALPALSLSTSSALRRIADPAAAGRLVRLIRRTDGAQMPGIEIAASHEVAIPSSTPNRYHLLEVILDGQFVRLAMDGGEAPKICFSVTDANAVLALVEALPRG
jgi:hypothetical protein